MAQITDALGNVTEWPRDLEKRPTEKRINGQTAFTYTYETKTSRLKSVKDSLNQLTAYGYFVDDSLHTITYTNSVHTTPNVSFTYDPNYNRVVSMTDGTGTTNYAFNPVTVPPAIGAARLASVTAPSLTDDAIAYTYDELGRVIGRSIGASGNVASWGFDALGRVTAFNNALGSAPFDDPTHGFNYTYLTKSARPDYLDYPNTQRVAFSYYGNGTAATTGNGDRRLSELKNLGAGANGSGAMLSDFTYTYNAVGDIKTWGQANSGKPAGQTYTFGYDGADQLGSATLLDGATNATHASSWGYDVAGNRSSETVDGVTDPAIISPITGPANELLEAGGAGLMNFVGTVSVRSNVTVNGAAATMSTDQLSFTKQVSVTAGTNDFTIAATSTNPPAGHPPQTRTNHYEMQIGAGARRIFHYDANGSMTDNGAGQTYEWDAANRLSAIVYAATGGRTEFAYDGSGRRVRITEKANGGAVITDKRYLWDALALTEEYDAAGTTVNKRYMQGGVQDLAASAKYYLTEDHLGSVREIVDASGTPLTRYEYTVWGERTRARLSGTTDVDVDSSFTGHYTYVPTNGPNNTHTNLALAPFRAYDSGLGRWLSRDPIGEEGGSNLYCYVLGNPICLWDPLGLLDVYVFVWDFAGLKGSVGHVMVVPTFGNCPYVSQFPHAPGGRSVPNGPNTHFDFQQTMNAEGRPPDHVYQVPIPNPDGFFDTAEWANGLPTWDWYPDTRKGETHCARAAYDSLKAGGVPLPFLDGQIMPGTLGGILGGTKSVTNATNSHGPLFHTTQPGLR